MDKGGDEMITRTELARRLMIDENLLDYFIRRTPYYHDETKPLGWSFAMKIGLMVRLGWGWHESNDFFGRNPYLLEYEK
jgi:hypothetical protein